MNRCKFYVSNAIICNVIDTNLFNRDDVYPSSRYTTYEYEDDSAPHTSHDYYEASDYPGKLLDFYYICSFIVIY